MATARMESSPVCPICSKSNEVLKILETCKHNFCLPCLTSHSTRHKRKTIPCPTCQVECAVPSGGLEMLEDFTGVEMSDDISPAMKKHEQKTQVTDQIDQTRDLDKLVDVKCQICHHQNIVVQADNLCPKCDQLHLCKDCTTLHARNKATRHHVVVPFKAQAKGSAVCVKHNAHMTMHCTTCNKPACKICVMLEHGDHDVESLSDMIVTKINRVKATIKEREDEVKKLQCLKKQLARLMPVATQLDIQAVMLKDIEDHAQKWVDHIFTWKEDMKKQVNEKFQITADIQDSFKEASKVIEQLAKSLSKAGALLANTEQVPSFLEKLTTMQTELDKTPKMSHESNGQMYSEHLSELQQRYPKFRPKVPRLPIGNLDFQVASGEVTGMFKVASGDQSEQQLRHLKVQPEAPPLSKRKRDNQTTGEVTEIVKVASGDQSEQQQTHLKVQPEAPPLSKGKPAGKVTEIFTHTLEKNSKPDFIRFVTILGDKFAIAHNNYKTLHAIHIYEISGKFLRALKDHVKPSYDMSSTLHGKLAVLTNRNPRSASARSVKVIDPDNGSIISTLNPNIPVYARLFCVGLQNQFVFLTGLDRGEITIVNEDGSTQLKQKVDNIGVLESTISCSLRFIFIANYKKVHVFEMKGAGLVKTSTISVDTPDLDIIRGISATPRDHFIILNSQGKYSVNKCSQNYLVHQYSQKEGEEKWTTYDKKQILSGVNTSTREEPRISTNGHHIVLAIDNTFKVYKC